MGTKKATTTTVTKKAAAKPGKAPAAKASAPRTVEADAPGKARKLSAIDAAAKVLGQAGEAMSCPQLIEAMAKKGYWTSPVGKTPAATLYASLLKEITTKGKESRFVKVARGQFALRGSK